MTTLTPEELVQVAVQASVTEVLRRHRIQLFLVGLTTLLITLAITLPIIFSFHKDQTSTNKELRAANRATNELCVSIKTLSRNQVAGLTRQLAQAKGFAKEGIYFGLTKKQFDELRKLSDARLSAQLKAARIVANTDCSRI